jgi:hypothetical protein
MTATLQPPVAEGRDSAALRSRIRQHAPAVVLALAVLTPLALFAATVTPHGQPQPANDAPGRIGFVLVIAAAIATVWWLEIRARHFTAEADAIFVPTRFIVVVFGVFASLWVVYDHLVLDAFSRGKFGYLEWLTQVTTLASSRGIWNVWTPYPQQLCQLSRGWYLQGVPLVTTALQRVNSLRMHATRATFLRLPAASRR